MYRSLFILFLSILLTSAQTPCPNQCKCKKPTEVDCSRQGLTEIPKNIPPSATKIDLGMNNIATVPDNAFANAPNLETIDLRHNAIASLSNSAFNGLAYLESLFLVFNRLDDKTDWTSVNTLPKLRRLYLSHNQLTQIPPIQSPTLFNLVLDGNRIASATFPQTIELCVALKSVVLSGNNIEAIGSDDLKSLAKINIKNLDLKLNALSQVDPAAFKGIGLTLETLNLDHNRLDAVMIKNLLIGLVSGHNIALLTLSLGYNPLTELSKDLLSPLSTGILRNLQLDGMTFKTTDKAALTPVQKTLELLSFKENGLTEPPLDFTALTALQDLRIDGNLFKTIPALPKTLQRLTIARNSIEGWPSSAFDSLISLKGLDLSGNRVQNISNKPNEANSIARHLNSLQLLSMNNNPFNCSCHLVWFAQWAVNNPKKVLNFDKYTCASPQNMAGKFVKDLKGNPCLPRSFGDSPDPKNDRIYVVVRGFSGVELIGMLGMLLMFFLFVLLLKTPQIRRRIEERPHSDKQPLLA